MVHPANGGNNQFQSTPLMRGATRDQRRTGRVMVVSIHAPHARGDRRLAPLAPRGLVSIHAPHARGDCPLQLDVIERAGFNPRPSCEGRRIRSHRSANGVCFNPRPSCEGRPALGRETSTTTRFQSTPLMRGATGVLDVVGGLGPVSIHAPHARGDIYDYSYKQSSTGFNPRPSCEGRRQACKCSHR